MTIKAVIFDWAGTLIDFGSFAPMGAFVDAFDQFGIDVTIDEARSPMGMPKRAHIQTMLEMPRIKDAWTKAHGKVDDVAIDRVYDVFVPFNETVAGKYATLVPGALDTLLWLENRNIKIATTTGYTRSIMNHVLPEVEKQGFLPEVVICSDELIEGRPGPLGVYKCMVELGVHPASQIIKVDDTAAGLGEGVSAGCINVGVSLSGNLVGKTTDELATMGAEEKASLQSQAENALKAAGADHVIDTVADLPSLMQQL